MMHRTGLLLAAAVALLAACSAGSKRNRQAVTEEEDSALLQRFADQELRTNWNVSLIDRRQIIPGGPRKNDIPAIDYPEFLTISQMGRLLQPIDFGILLQVADDYRFYPFRILNWHEIVNDVVGGLPVAVTFCPLCGSAMVFNRIVNGDTLSFGVSGQLYESNLLMFDEATESLWLQASGQCVVGDYAGSRLQLVNSVVLSFEDVVNRFPQARVLGFNTGFDRDYLQNPYVEYEHTEELYFPVSQQNNRFASKDMMYVVVVDSFTVALHWKSLVQKGRVQVSTPSAVVVVEVNDYIPQARNSGSNELLAGYFTYWFSWYAVHGQSGTYWPQKP